MMVSVRAANGKEAETLAEKEAETALSGEVCHQAAKRAWVP
jgi:hypothetical protein